MAGMLRVPRSRGALSGICLILLGAWGALIPFIGPYFHYAYTPDTGWTYTTGRLWLEILPGAAAFLGGLIVLTAASRPAALFGAWLAVMSGAWFVVGKPLSTLWTAGAVPAAGSPVGGTLTRAVEQVGFFGGLGAAIIFFAALALGRFTVLGHREVVAAQEAAMAEQAAGHPVTDRAPADRAVTEPVTADRMPAGVPTDRAAADRTAASQAAFQRMAADRATAEQARTERMAAQRPAAEQATTDRDTATPGATEPGATEPGATEQRAAQRPAAEQATTDRDTTDRGTATPGATEQRAAQRPAAEQATTERMTAPAAGTSPAATPDETARSEPAPGSRTAP